MLCVLTLALTQPLLKTIEIKENDFFTFSYKVEAAENL